MEQVYCALEIIDDADMDKPAVAGEDDVEVVIVTLSETVHSDEEEVVELTCDEKKAEINGLFTEQALLSEEEFTIL